MSRRRKRQPDTDAPPMPKKAGGKPDARDSTAPAARKRPATAKGAPMASKRRSPAGNPRPAISPLDRVFDAPISKYRAISADPEARIEQRWADAIEVARQAGILCTGAPEQPDCDEPAAVGLTLNGRLFALPCRAHVPSLLRPLLGNGHARVTSVSIAALLEIRGKSVIKSAAFLRDVNQRIGVLIPGREDERGRS